MTKAVLIVSVLVLQEVFAQTIKRIKEFPPGSVVFWSHVEGNMIWWLDRTKLLEPADSDAVQGSLVTKPPTLNLWAKPFTSLRPRQTRDNKMRCAIVRVPFPERKASFKAAKAA